MKAFTIFVVLSYINLLNFIDRGVIPGAPNEFNSFIQSDLDTSTPDVYLGLLQSAFIIGILLGLFTFGHLVHYYARFYLTAIGMSIWISAVILCGISRFTGSYTFLLFARVISGLGEASLQVTAPPWIQDFAPEEQRGIWLAVFNTAIPVGTALGYAISSVIAESVGWEYTYFLEALVMAPGVAFLIYVAPQYPVTAVGPSAGAASVKIGALQSPLLKNQEANADAEADGGEGGEIGERGLTEEDTEGTGFVGHSVLPSELPHIVTKTAVQAFTEEHKPTPTVWEEFKTVLARPIFLLIVFSFAAQTAVTIGLSTFGTEVLIGLGYFDSESAAATVFGIVVSLCGLIFTPLGGIILDRTNKYYSALDCFSASYDERQAMDGRRISTYRDNRGSRAGRGSIDGTSAGNGADTVEIDSSADIERDVDAAERQAWLKSSSSHNRDSAQIEVISSMHARENDPAAAVGMRRRVYNSRGVSQSTEQIPDISENVPYKRAVLRSLFVQLHIYAWCGLALLVASYFIHQREAYIMALALGASFTFMQNPGFSMGIMMSVPTLHRSFALALYTLGLHVLGDVPAPVIVGLLKDSLAPACNSDAASDDDALTSDACRSQSGGLRLAFLLISVWLLWQPLIFMLGSYFLRAESGVLAADGTFSPYGPCACCTCCTSRGVSEHALGRSGSRTDADETDKARRVSGEVRHIHASSTSSTSSGCSSISKNNDNSNDKNSVRGAPSFASQQMKHA